MASNPPFPAGTPGVHKDTAASAALAACPLAHDAPNRVRRCHGSITTGSAGGARRE
jgi:hypothetical protein